MGDTLFAKVCDTFPLLCIEETDNDEASLGAAIDFGSSTVPSDAPSLIPSNSPSMQRSQAPSKSMIPSDAPSLVPSNAPSTSPSSIPSDAPSLIPSTFPTTVLQGLYASPAHPFVTRAPSPSPSTNGNSSIANAIDMNDSNFILGTASLDRKYKSAGIFSSTELVVVCCTFIVMLALLLYSMCVRSFQKRRRMAFRALLPNDHQGRIDGEVESMDDELFIEDDPEDIFGEKAPPLTDNDGIEVTMDLWAFEQDQDQLHSSDAPDKITNDPLSDEEDHQTKVLGDAFAEELHIAEQTHPRKSQSSNPNLPFCGAFQRVADAYFGSSSSTNRLPTIDSGSSFTESSVNLNAFDAESDKVCLYPSVQHGEI